MPIRFRCPSCRQLLSIGRRKAGTEIECTTCYYRQTVPDRVNLEPSVISRPQCSVNPRRATEVTARLVSWTFALAMLGLLGWLTWIFPRSSPQVRGQHLGGNEPLANLAPGSPLPLLQPEVESTPTDAAAPLPLRRPTPPDPPAAAKKRSAEPPPEIDRRPPDLPSPPRSAKTPKKDSPPSTNRSEAELLKEQLLRAAAEQQDELLEKLRQGKGTEYTEALVIAIGQLMGEGKEKARQALVSRLTRFTSATLLSYLGNESPELRSAAALAIGKKDDKDRIGDLLDLLDDAEPAVVQAAHVALKRLTKPAPTSESKASSANRVEARAEPKAPPRPEPEPPTRKMPVVKAKVPDPPVAKTAPPKKSEDVPDVALVPPAEASSSVMAVIRVQAIALHAKKAAERIQAAQTLGALGADGKPARRLLCAAMIDPVVEVRAAAADALKNIDPKMHYLAVVLATEKVAADADAQRVASLLEKIQKLEEDGEPLIPLVAFVVKFAAVNGTPPLLLAALTTLSRIGRRDLASYQIVATALTNQDMKIRSLALRELARMKHGKLAVPRILALLKSDTPANRIVAMETLVALADESSEEIIAAAIAAQRYHDKEEVRQAVAAALNKLESKHDP
jgi:HEAT repeat protein